MKGKLAALVTVVDQHGTTEMAASALLRYLAETPWFPTALLPSAGVRWTAMSDSTVAAALTDGSVTVSMHVHFGPGGEITEGAGPHLRD